VRVGENDHLPLVIVVFVVLVAGVIWRARTTRRLTIEESVDRYRRTLSAVHEAAARSQTTEDDAPGPLRNEPPRFEPTRFDPAGRTSKRYSGAGSRRSLAVVAMAVLTVVVMAVVIAASRGHGSRSSAATTTTRAPVTHPSTSTQAPSTTSVPLVTATGASRTAFTVATASYTLVVQTTTAACWVDARTPSGTSLFSGTLSAGQAQSITATAITLRLGNPAAVTLSIAGQPVSFPLAGGSPVTLQFQGRSA
jgi:cytoskeletal protein RodZ